jgi:hypothetical protein
MPVTPAMIEAAWKVAGLDVSRETIREILEAAARARWQPEIAPSGLQICPHCHKEWHEGGTCGMGGCPMGGDF